MTWQSSTRFRILARAVINLPGKYNMAKPIGFREFVALMALSMSLVALAIDAMLPALAEIATDLSVVDDNDRQLVITSLFLGLATGMLFYGPVSDSFGRRPPMFVGFALFIIGSVAAALAQSFEVLLAARFVQGLGAAGSRILTVAIVRDGAGGREMARVMSLVMMTFILVPALAPALGQVILLVANWRMIFVALVVTALVTVCWFYLRQPESLPPENRKPFSLDRIGDAFMEILRNRSAVIYTIAAGMIFGSFIGFLLQELYQLGGQFPLYFAVLALTIGVSSWVNARLVTRYGMRYLCRIALRAIALSAAVFLVICMFGLPPLGLTMIYLMVSFFCTGILFGNLNALAMDPLGHIAGMASSMIGAATTFISLILGYLIGFFYNFTMVPVTLGFGLLSLVSLGLFYVAEKDEVQLASAT
jgi:DHA1 family bicyclomycin/chloramphenicol resistance-like MFS transporter